MSAAAVMYDCATCGVSFGLDGSVPSLGDVAWYLDEVADHEAGRCGR